LAVLALTCSVASSEGPAKDKSGPLITMDDPVKAKLEQKLSANSNSPGLSRTLCKT
jgi:hypothetical protein